MKQSTKNILLIALIIIIIAAIVYIDIKKPKHILPSDVADIAVPTVINTPLTTPLSKTATASVATPSTPIILNRSAIQAQKAKIYSKGKELVGIDGYINTPAFKLSDYAGKDVILIDFWTYSCINCQRTIPYLNAWYQKYKDQGLVIVGVSAPEFDFEKNYNNVAAAVKQYGIKYPVVLDNEMQTWDAYNNEYWPAEYLIDVDGYVVHTNFGEGNYAETEEAIQTALKERDAALGLPDTVPTGIVDPTNAVSTDASQVQSPETYFGAERNEYLANGTQNTTGSQTLMLPGMSVMNQNALYLEGTWNFNPQYAESTSSTAKIVYEYNAKNVYMVASSQNGVRAKVLIDGKPIDPSIAGSDVSADGTVLIQADKLYNLVKGSSYGAHTLELDVESSGLDAYTFTFG